MTEQEYYQERNEFEIAEHFQNSDLFEAVSDLWRKKPSKRDMLMSC